MVLPADVAAPPVASAVGVSAAFLLVPIIVAETIVLRVLRWGSLGISFIAALAMNAASSLVGFLLLNAANPSADDTAALLVLLLPAWALSTLIEGGVMWAIRRLPVRRTLGVAAIANAASYLLLAAFVLLGGLG